MVTCLFVTAAVAVGIGLICLAVGHRPRMTGHSGEHERVFPKRGTHEPKWSISQRRARTMT
jgi:hypothetical protein